MPTYHKTFNFNFPQMQQIDINIPPISNLCDVKAFYSFPNIVIEYTYYRIRVDKSAFTLEIREVATSEQLSDEQIRKIKFDTLDEQTVVKQTINESILQMVNGNSKLVRIYKTQKWEAIDSTPNDVELPDLLNKIGLDGPSLAQVYCNGSTSSIPCDFSNNKELIKYLIKTRETVRE